MEPFLGQISMFGGNFAPRSWAFCDGQLLAISQNSALFSILGTTYGGDGRTTFGLPDLRGRVPIHEGSGPGLPPVSLGERGGNATTTLNVNNLPSHTHIATANTTATISCNNLGGDTDNPEGAFPGVSNEDVYHEEQNASMAAGIVNVNTTVANGNTGNNTNFSNMQPFTSINFIIALQGTFPSRS